MRRTLPIIQPSSICRKKKRRRRNSDSIDMAAGIHSVKFSTSLRLLRRRNGAVIETNEVTHGLAVDDDVSVAERYFVRVVCVVVVHGSVRTLSSHQSHRETKIDRSQLEGYCNRFSWHRSVSSNVLFSAWMIGILRPRLIAFGLKT